MKRTVMTAIALALGSAVAIMSYAQGRHDEKPHGEGKPAARATEQGSMMPGRHDERPHGTKKPAAKKKQQEKSGAGAEAGKSDK